MKIERIPPTEPEFRLTVTREELIKIRRGLVNHDPNLWRQIQDVLESF